MDNMNINRLTEDDILNMQERQEKTLTDINNLQEREKEIYNNIDIDLANEKLNEDTLKSRISKIDELISIRDTLFKNLGDVYKFQKDSVSDSRNDLVNRITTAKILENELSNVRNHYDNLDREKNTKIRINQINTYYTKKHKAQTNMMKSILFCIFVILILSIIRNKTQLPKSVIEYIIIVVGVLGILKFIYDLHDINRRSKMDFDKYDYSWKIKSEKNDKEDNNDELDFIDKSIDESVSSSKLPSLCYNEHCCSDETTYDSDLGRCVPNTIETFKPNLSEIKYDVSLY